MPILEGMGPRALTRMLLVAAVAVMAHPAAAYRRLVEHDDRLARPAFAVVAGVGTYAPASGSGNASLNLSAGLRYLRADKDDDTWHSLGFELGASTWSSSSADIMSTYGEVLYFWPRTEAFTFDHHFFAGAGVGLSQVDRAGTTADQQMGQIEGGLQGRIRDWFLELRLKYLFGPRNADFNIEGWAPSLSAAYHFDI